MSSGHGLFPVHPPQPHICWENGSPTVEQNVHQTLESMQPVMCLREFSSVLENPNPMELSPAGPRGARGYIMREALPLSISASPWQILQTRELQRQPHLKVSMRCIKDSLSLVFIPCPLHVHPISLQECLLFATEIISIFVRKTLDVYNLSKTLHCRRTKPTRTGLQSHCNG